MFYKCNEKCLECCFCYVCEDSLKKHEINWRIIYALVPTEQPEWVNINEKVILGEFFQKNFNFLISLRGGIKAIKEKYGLSKK